MRIRASTGWTALLGAGAPAPSPAHPGHGLAGDAYGALHYLTEPAHLAGAVLVVVVLLLTPSAWRAVRARVSRRGS
jgi:hypothetical protein